MNKYEQMAEELKNSSRETFIYGCGNCGSVLHKELIRSGVSVSGFLLDDEYKKFNEYNGKPVSGISEFLKGRAKPCNIVIGFVGLSEERERRLQESNIYIYI